MDNTYGGSITISRAGVRMKKYRVSESSRIKAPSKEVYSVLADYRGGHPHILPKKYFSHLSIEQGGVGAGTTIRFEMHAMGRTKSFRAAITELVPGRTLVETDLESGAVTTFTVLPIENDNGSHVTISTELASRDGLIGLFERAMISSFLRRVYAQELKSLAEFVGGKER